MPSSEILPFVFRNPVSSLTHLGWCLWAVWVTGILWKLARGDRWRRLSVGCFGLSMVLLYGASGTYHAIPRSEEWLVEQFRKLDHSAIYVLIAGTGTPVFTVLLRGRLRVWMLSLVWALAAVGVACKWLLPAPPYALTVALYVAMGWLGLIPAYALFRVVGLRGLSLVFLGGVLYTAGAVCDATEWPVLLPGVVGYHEMLHVFDMGGTLVHVLFVVRYVLPFRG
jgi:hemolysin III